MAIAHRLSTIKDADYIIFMDKFYKKLIYLIYNLKRNKEFKNFHYTLFENEKDKLLENQVESQVNENSFMNALNELINIFDKSN